jgi:chorismate mutase / prephenate dehydratase
MAKRKKKTARGATPAELQKRLDQADRALVGALHDRAKIATQLATLQKENGQPPWDDAGERRRLDDLAAGGGGPLPPENVRRILRELQSGSRSLVRAVRVAYLGPKYSFSHLAAVERFGTAADLVPLANIPAVFEEVNRRQVDCGLVPIENSTDGRVIDTLGMFARLPVRICGEVQLRIRHNLLGKCPQAEVREVYSKPQALSQCRLWLARNLPQARTIEMTSTAAAAELAAQRQGAAAIASFEAGVNYGLEVIAANVEDNPHNVTRFAVIGGEAPPRTGRDKTSLMFELPHKPGALADATTIFKKANLNLTWIESFPTPATKSEYLFFVELEGHPNEARVKKALDALKRKTVKLDVLGAYAKSEPVE